jgi:feruloyl esterase
MRRAHGAAAILGVLIACRAASAATCESLRSVPLEHTMVTAATIVPAGAFAPSQTFDVQPPSTTFASLPEFCRVEGISSPTSGSQIGFEIWLPTSRWSGRYMGVGNGGAGGAVNYFAPNGPSLAEALRQGFAASSTDAGHRGADDDFSFARGHREQRIDYHYRAVHETALAAKAVIRVFYGAAPKYSYFSGCSDGGRQGLMEAQRYPSDYDGVLVCGPAVHRTHSVSAWIWVAQAVAAEPESEIPPSKLPMIHDAVVASCDALDGLQDGLVAEPMKCRFDPNSLLCKGADSERCLTQPQVTTLKRFYSGPQDSRGEPIASGFLPGAETDPVGAISCRSCKGSAFHRASIFLDGLFDARFDVKTFDFDRDFKALERTEDAKLTNTTRPNLKPFKDRGAKLIIVHGWSDGADPAMPSVKYYQTVVSMMGQKAVDQFFRLYMIPGVYHNASRGPGPTAFPGPMLKALEDWVENDAVPNAVIGTSYKIDGDPASGVMRTRPLCPYPQVAAYKGTGSANEATNFVCKTSSK